MIPYISAVLTEKADIEIGSIVVLVRKVTKAVPLLTSIQSAAKVCGVAQHLV
jgi:hypothetical protein